MIYVVIWYEDYKYKSKVFESECTALSYSFDLFGRSKYIRVCPINL